MIDPEELHIFARTAYHAALVITASGLFLILMQCIEG